MDPCRTSHVIGNISALTSLIHTYWDLFERQLCMQLDATPRIP